MKKLPNMYNTVFCGKIVGVENKEVIKTKYDPFSKKKISLLTWMTCQFIVVNKLG